MKKLSVFVFLFSCFLSFFVQAEEGNEAIADNDNANISYEIKGGETIIPSGSLPLPDCDDERLLELVRGEIIGYQHRNPAKSIIEKRQQMLMLKRISALSDTSSENVTSKENFKLANELITLKINKAISARDINVCKGPKGVNDTYLYVVVYNDGSFIKGKILNFSDNSPKEQELEVLY